MQNNAQQAAEKIRTRYVEKQTTDLDTLRALDNKVKRPANIFAYIFGSVSAIIMGAGMSLIMTDIAGKIGFGGNAMTLGIVIGIVGMLMALSNYSIHKAMMNARKKKYASEIVALSDKIMNK